jgi:effector-binding domain-containing protein
LSLSAVSAAGTEAPVAVLKKLLIGIAVLVVGLAAIGMLLPRQVHLERRITIDAPKATIYTLVDGYKQFNKWSPWAPKDPNCKYTWDGPEFGVGAKQSWVGDPKTVGSGSQEIVATKPFEQVTTKIVFTGQGEATARMTLTPATNGTDVVWGFDSDVGAGPVGRYFGLLMDHFVGPDFEKGLANLKTLAESLPKDDFADLQVSAYQAQPVTVAYLSTQSAKDMQAIAAAIGSAYMKVGAFMKANGLSQAGAPMTINTRWDDAGYAFDAAIPVDKAPAKDVPADAPVKVKSTYAGKALKIVHKGPYAGLAPTYQKIAAYMAARGYKAAGPAWDEYVSDPGSTPEAELVTNIVQPIE